jgi:Ca2+/Na+ antiporter
MMMVTFSVAISILAIVCPFVCLLMQIGQKFQWFHVVMIIFAVEKIYPLKVTWKYQKQLEKNMTQEERAEYQAQAARLQTAVTCLRICCLCRV